MKLRHIYMVLFIMLQHLSVCVMAKPVMKTLDIESGLSDNFVMSVASDNLGYIWVATEFGLNRFDGSKFTCFYKDQISGNELNKVVTNGSYVYIATQRDGLSVFDNHRETFTNYSARTGRITADDITDIVPASNDKVWLTYYWEGLDLFDAQTQSVKHYTTSVIDGLGSNQVWTAAVDGQGLLYVGHVGSGLSVVNLNTNTAVNYRHDPSDPFSLPANDVHVLMSDNRGGVWVGTDMGLAYFINGKFQLIPQIKGRVRSLRQMNDDSIWVGLENGGVNIILTPHGFLNTVDALKVTNPNYGVETSTVKSICQDSFGNIWLGVQGGGVRFISSRESFFDKITSVDDELSWRVAWGMTVDADGRLWAGTDGGGLDVYEGHKKVGHYDSRNSALTDNAILSALSDSQGGLWFGTFGGGLNFFDAASHRFSRVMLASEAMDIRVIREGHSGILVGTCAGLYVLDKKTHDVIQIMNRDNSALEDNFVRAVYEGDDNTLWVGTFGHGLSVFKTDDTQHLLASFVDSTFISNTVHCIFYQESARRVWVATGNGVAMFDASDYSKYETFELEGQVTYGIIEGNYNQIWVSTNKGVSCIDVNNKKIYNFDYRDGMPRGIYHGGSVCKDGKGLLYFGSENGVCVVKPDLYRWPSEIPEGVITGFKYFGGDVPDEFLSKPVSEPVELEFVNHTFSIEYNVLDYSLGDMVEFSYKLEGLDKMWHLAGNSNETTYRDVPAGDYKFQVKVKTRNGCWSTDISSVDIVVNPPFYLSTWAKLLYAILFVSVVWLFIYLRNRQMTLKQNLIIERENNIRQKQLDEERLKFFTNMTHELRTPLTLILGPLEDLKHDKAIPAKQAIKIALIHNSATKLLSLINRILDFRKTETQNKKLFVKYGDIRRVVSEIVSSYKELNRNNNMTYALNVDPLVPQSMLFDADVISTIVNNLLSNSVKYTDNGSINVSVSLVEGNQRCVCITVTDTGIGIPSMSLGRIFDRYYQVDDSSRRASGTGIGLSLVRNLVYLHEGNITVTSEVGSGSTFKVFIPIKDDYPNAIRLDDAGTVEEAVITANEGNADNEMSIGRKPILLVVEDNEDISAYVADLFAENFDVMCAANGQAGLSMARKSLPDIIISDVMMPKMDGMEMCKHIKEDITTSHIPVILLTAKDTNDDKTEGYQCGADSYLTKPFTASLLRSRVDNILESRRRLASVFVGNKSQDSKSAEQLRASLSQMDSEFVDKFKAIVVENIENDKIDVNFVAEKLMMSHSTLYRKIKSLTGLSANEFIRKIRMHNAEQLLLTGRYNINEVAFMVGISSMAYFRQCFKEEFGLAPSAYLKSLEDNTNRS